jgi:glycosyltransferase involved in cell wall biosynthesis
VSLRIAHIVRSLDARDGGPSVSIPRLAAATAACGHRLTLLATGDATPPFLPADVDIRLFGPTGPKWIGASLGLARHVAGAELDVIHSHGLWRRTLHYAHRRSAGGRPLHVISPRGMMTPWAWNHHRRRKQFAARLIHPDALVAAHAWHATSNDEADDIRRLGFKQPICVAPNGVDTPDESATRAALETWTQAAPPPDRMRTALFYSRFHPKKRVLELIDLWQAVAPKNWRLLLVGIPETYSVGQLEAYVARGSSPARIEVFDGTGRPPPYALASLFLLPTHSENFGLVVAEALAHGLPVVVTDQTPWREVGPAGGGWCVPFAAFAETVRAATALPAEALAAAGQSGRTWVLANYSWLASARALADFYGSLLSRG